MTLANRLTLARALLVLPYAVLAVSGQTVLAAVVFALAAATDVLDGVAARQRSEVTTLGSVLDPIADKMLTITAFLVLAYLGRLADGLFFAALLITLRELWVSGLREGLIAQGGELPVSTLAKIKTGIQLLALLILTLSGGPIGAILLWIALALTLWSGWQYTRLAFRMMNLGADVPTKDE
ncbi:MAG: CDP-alcohol phosphatidyltransferase family protein [Parvularcula sp.]|jgi:CDP-diacylglycerol--glycerol-3-phosphate 3-phosphatidyltransferase|nr:CDP-alcohol phosphatidyltransferase family protein [Parvularcula sp.]